MTDSTTRFTGLGKIYASARPTYPADSIRYIAEIAKLQPGAEVVDVGAGTGISSRIFASHGYEVIALEPNDDMRKTGEEACTVFGAPPTQTHIQYLAGTGERTGLEAGSADLVLCAQAFHWLAPEAALEEFHRILKPAAWVALVWNERDEQDAFTAAYGKALRQMAPQAEKTETRREEARQPLLASPLFVSAHKKTFSNSQTVDANGLIDRAFSASYAPKDEQMAEGLRTKLTSVFDDFQNNGLVDLKYETLVFLAKK